jgi:hypothetical protein
MFDYVLARALALQQLHRRAVLAHRARPLRWPLRLSLATVLPAAASRAICHAALVSVPPSTMCHAAFVSVPPGRPGRRPTPAPGSSSTTQTQDSNTSPCRRRCCSNAWQSATDTSRGYTRRRAAPAHSRQPARSLLAHRRPAVAPLPAPSRHATAIHATSIHATPIHVAAAARRSRARRAWAS